MPPHHFRECDSHVFFNPSNQNLTMAMVKYVHATECLWTMEKIWVSNFWTPNIPWTTFHPKSFLEKAAFYLKVTFLIETGYRRMDAMPFCSSGF